MDELSDNSKEALRIRQGELISILESFAKLGRTEEWATIKELVFDRSLASIERMLFQESVRMEIKPDEIYRLQGERNWAKRYSDTERFMEAHKRELEKIKQLLK